MLPRLDALQLGRELDALRFAAGEFGRGLAEPQVAEADLLQHIERAGEVRLVGEEFRGGIDGQAEHFGDVLAAVFDLERLRVVARAVAGRAGRIDARQEEQLDENEAFAFARFAAAFLYVEGKAARVVAMPPRVFCFGEKPAHMIEKAGVGREVRARRAADRFLIHAHEPLDRFHPAGDLAALGHDCGALQLLAFLLIHRRFVPEMLRDQFDQHLADEARFARARDAGHGRENPERKSDVEMVQIVARRRRWSCSQPRGSRGVRRGGGMVAEKMPSGLR